LNHPKFSLSAFFWQPDLLDLAKETSCRPAETISSLACPLGIGACVTTGPQADPTGRSPRAPGGIWLTQSEKHVTPDLGVEGLSPTLDVETTINK